MPCVSSRPLRIQTCLVHRAAIGALEAVSAPIEINGHIKTTPFSTSADQQHLTMSTIVIGKFATTEAYRNDTHIADDGLRLISSREGVLGCVPSRNCPHRSVYSLSCCVEPITVFKSRIRTSGCPFTVSFYFHYHTVSAKRIFRHPVCTSPEVFLKVVQDKELYQTIQDRLSAVRIGDPELYHGIAVGDPFKALIGPIHEVSCSFIMFFSCIVWYTDSCRH